MLRIRLKMGPSATSKEWRCCFGLHVRTATIIIGVWHLCLNLLALGIISIIIRTNNYHLLFDDMNDIEDNGNEPPAPVLPTPLSKVDRPYAYIERFQQSGLHSNDVDMSGLVFLCMIAVTLMLIYGAVKPKPSHLLPFFCLQIFDFAIATLTAANHLCYIRSIHMWITESQNRLPWKEELVKLSPQTLSVLVLVGFILFIFLKAYAIGIVWRCYKFLTFRQHNMRSMLPYIIPDIPDTPESNNRRQERDSNSLLPDYDEAVAQSLKQAPPPSYVVAMSMNNKGITQVDATPEEAVNVNSNENVNFSDPPPYNAVEDAAVQQAVTTIDVVPVIVVPASSDTERPQRTIESNRT